MTFMVETSEENLPCVIHHIIGRQKFAKENLNKPDAFQKQVKKVENRTFWPQWPRYVW